MHLSTVGDLEKLCIRTLREQHAGIGSENALILCVSKIKIKVYDLEQAGGLNLRFVEIINARSNQECT